MNDTGIGAPCHAAPGNFRVALCALIGILLEHHRGILPVWAAPTQFAIASISDKASVWAETIFSRLKQLGVRVELHNQDRTISKKIRELSKRRIPLIAIVGEQEAMTQTLNLRRLGAVEQQEISLAQLEHALADLAMQSKFLTLIPRS